MGGRWIDTARDEWMDDINPSNPRDIVAQVPRGDAADVTAAVTAAAEALGTWRRLAGPARADHLYRWSQAIADRHEEMAQMLCREVGKPIGEARGEVGRCVMILRYFAGEAVRGIGDVIPAQAAGSLQFTLREPLGVIGLITPWNFPVAIPMWKAAPALAFGNVVVLKPSEAAARSAMLLAETASAAGIPAGVFNVVLGTGASIGRTLIEAEAVRGVSFTGSARVGAEVAATAAKRNIRYQTEMGGKNVAIVLADADLDQAATLTAAGAMRYAGQKCTATSRVVIAREVEDAFYKALRAQIDRLPLGPVSDPASAIGPLISETSRANIGRALERHGGEPFMRVEVPKTGDYAHGYFMAPVVYRDVPIDAPLAREELFGPVLASFVARDADEALEIANHAQYGLSATLFTRDLRAALRYIDRIEAGLVRVNGDTTGVDPHAPFGGMKGSSSGSREQGPAAKEFYTEIKTVQINP
ncbi:MAG TPA: aldehyde dehydrogenase family protein [Gemmatimonadaceae bacterium]|nr:aldehyde dehydrogenase family protein [Gemmatimonadaceae bacterium]